MIFLTAPLYMQQSPAYESALNLLRQRHDQEHLAADRDLFSDMKTYNKSWKQVYDPENAEALYLLAREDGTIGLGTYGPWKWLSKKHDVPASLLFTVGEQAAESEYSDKVFALVGPEPVRSDSTPRVAYEQSNIVGVDLPGRGDLGTWTVPDVRERARAFKSSVACRVGIHTLCFSLSCMLILRTSQDRCLVLCILTDPSPTSQVLTEVAKKIQLGARRAQQAAHSPRRPLPVESYS